MLSGLRQWFAARFAWSEDEGGDETEESGFVPSVLDASVLYAHGMSRSSAEGELANVEEKARILEEQQRDE